MTPDPVPVGVVRVTTLGVTLLAMSSCWPEAAPTRLPLPPEDRIHRMEDMLHKGMEDNKKLQAENAKLKAEIEKLKEQLEAK